MVPQRTGAHVVCVCVREREGEKERLSSEETCIWGCVCHLEVTGPCISVCVCGVSLRGEETVYPGVCVCVCVCVCDSGVKGLYI